MLVNLACLPVKEFRSFRCCHRGGPQAGDGFKLKSHIAQINPTVIGKSQKVQIQSEAPDFISQNDREYSCIISSTFK